MQNLTLFCQSSLGRFSWRTILSLLALFVGLGSSQSVWAQQAIFYDESVSFNQQPTSSTSTSVSYAGAVYPGDAPYTTYVKLGNTSTNPAAPNPNLGTYDVNTPRTSQLFFTAASIVGDVTTGKNNAVIGTINQARVLYRIYLNGSSTLPQYTVLNLQDAGVFATGGELYNATVNVDILQNLPGGGFYTFDVQYQLDIKNSTTGAVTTYTDPSASYQANFTITAPAVTPNGGTTTWISQTNTDAGTDWLNPANWTNGVPTRNADAIIPDKAPTTGFTVTPLLGDPTKHYEVKNLTLNGQTNSTRALVRIGQSTSNGAPIGATLRVYGDLNNYAAGLLGGVVGAPGVQDSTLNSTVVFARNDGNPQAIRGLLSVTDIRVEGSGIKAVIDEVDVLNTLAFNPNAKGAGAILRTAVDNATFDLKTTQTTKVVINSTGVLQGETNTSYIQGVTISERTMSVGIQQTFGNIGLDLTATLPVSGTIKITRTVGDPLTPPSFASNPLPIKRQYGVTGDVNNGNTTDIVFHYLNSTDELNNNPEQNLTIFKTANNGPPYNLVGRTGVVDLANKKVTRLAYTGSLNTLTLGDEFNPLPVVLVSFNATRNATNASLTWSTATETNSKGFEVQVSTDGTAFRTLGFVSSETPNSTQAKSYQYVDTETGKVGIRYYRLHQVDLDGKDSYSPVRAVNFDGTATDVALSAYPNPFVDKVAFNLDATTIGAAGNAQVQLLDMTGRIVREQNLTVQNASLTLDNLNDLRSGLYLVRITLPDGSAKTLRVQKQ